LSKRDKKKMFSVSIKVLSLKDYQKPKEYEIRERETPSKISLERRTGVNEVELPFVEEEARIQAQRCLICHINTIYDSEVCILCGACVDFCPNNCLKLVPYSEIDLEQREMIDGKMKNSKRDILTAMIKDEITCIRCGICATVCPTGAMTMERFSFKEM
jgi:ferredoxin